MKYRATLVYLLAAAVLVGLYFFETRKLEKEEKAEETARLLFQVEPDRLRALTLTKGDTLIRIEKGAEDLPDSWKITSPIQADADGYEVSRWAEKIAGLKSLRNISVEPGDLSEFGLDKPGMSISYSSGEGDGTIIFGSRSPVEDGFYARKGEEKKVFLVGASEKKELDISLYTLRDKRLFSLTAEAVTRVVFTRGADSWVFRKWEDRWIMEEDESLQIDSEKLDGLIRRTLWLEAASFERESSDGPLPFGLESPGVKVTLSDSEKTEEILLGDEVKIGGRKRHYAKIVARPQILTLEPYFMESLPESGKALEKREEQAGVSNQGAQEGDQGVSDDNGSLNPGGGTKVSP